MGNGDLFIEKAEFNGKNVYIVVFRNKIGKTLFQGFVNAQYSKQRRILEKTYKQ